MKNTISTIFSILIILVLIAGVYFIVQTMRETAAAAAAPFQGIQQANESMQTQVSQLLNPTPTIIPDPVTYINEIRALARLETIQYSVSQVVTSEINQGTLAFALGTKILVVVYGNVIAGIDMQKQNPSDMRMQDGILYVRLPPAEILAITINQRKTEVYTVQEGLFADPDPSMVIGALQGAEDKIMTAALEDGILAQAQTNGETYLQKFFMALGFKTVVFEH
jgi:cbb3-type cytochrome oxidase subunit 3